MIWKYKDANRVWWRLEVEIERPDSSHSVIEDGERVNLDNPDHWWTYRLVNEDTETIMFQGEVWGQYELQPDITQFLADIQNQTNNLCLGIAKYAEHI
jgi:hypothetical protein